MTTEIAILAALLVDSLDLNMDRGDDHPDMVLWERLLERQAIVAESKVRA